MTNLASNAALAYFDMNFKFEGPVETIWYPLATYHSLGLYHIANYLPYARPHAQGDRYPDAYLRPALYRFNNYNKYYNFIYNTEDSNYHYLPELFIYMSWYDFYKGRNLYIIPYLGSAIARFLQLAAE